MIIAARRHHIRTFPEDKVATNKHGNPFPVILVEHDCITPFERDSYLYPYIALPGTVWPVHYTIVHDESNHISNVIRNMIDERCHQYMCLTASVPLFPAVYSAHLASGRARAQVKHLLFIVLVLVRLVFYMSFVVPNKTEREKTNSPKMRQRNVTDQCERWA